ncbi:MAG: zinc ABC transporter substrate-binding protein [Desulfobacterales bacterium]|nr:zinc ABC transporter substrate-binding protein [Desulfobacterales bacterium]
MTVRRRGVWWVGPFFAVIIFFVLFTKTDVHPKSPAHDREKIKVFVSILPQAYFVERVGGERVDAYVMVGPGHSPATYEPMPKQMAELSKARLYFRIGVPFENVWMARVSKENPNMKVIDTRRGIELFAAKPSHHAKSEQHMEGHGETRGLQNPHIWTSLRLVKIQAQNIRDALIEEDPNHRDYYQSNLEAFHDDLDKLDAEITEILKSLNARKFMVFHPAWGYFARDYGLEEIPVEMEGKEPSAKTLACLIECAIGHGIRVVFVQQQFSKKSAEVVARTIGGRVIKIDPLAKDYLNNMRKIAETFGRVMQ